jgi:5'-nucleotidase
MIFAEDVTLTILHTNDTYGQLLPFSKEGMKVGGVLRRAYLIRQIREEQPDNLIVLDAGDAIGPHPLAAFDSGETVIQLMNEMGYTAMALGNHEFNYGVKTLLERISQAQVAVLSANTYLKGKNELLAQGYIKKEVAGIKVGIIGLTTPTTRYRASPQLQKSITFTNPISAAKDAVKKLKAEGCDFIIALSHLGYQDDMELIAQVGEINLVIGSEVDLPTEKTISVMSPIDNASGTTLVYCPWFGEYIGRVDVQFEKQTDGGYIIKNVQARKYRLDDKTYPDESVFALVPDLKTNLERLVTNYQNTYSGVLGRVAENEKINSLELIPLIIRKQTKAEIVLLNRGSLQAEVIEGDIQRLQVAEYIRYSNQIVILELTGAQLKDALTHSKKQVSESRKLILLGLDSAGTMVNGRPINPNEYYSVATNDFLASGGDGYDMIASARGKKYTGRMLRQVVIDYIQATQESGQPLSIAPLKASLPDFIVKSKVGLDLMLKSLTVSETAKNYPQIALLQSKNIGNFAHWSIQSDLSTLIASSKYNLELSLISKYGRLKYPKLPSIELDDNTKAAAVFRFLLDKRKLNPITRLEIENIELTPSEKNRIIAQLSAGVERKIVADITISGGILLRRCQHKDISQNQANFDFRANYKTIAKGVQIQSELKIFPIVINTVSSGRLFKDYIASFSNTAKFPLNKYLFLSTSAIFYRETQIGPWAHNAQIAIQLHRTWGKKP